jgi:arylsulfatase A-like enzyme
VPTLLELVGADIPGHLQGESRVPVLKGEATLEGNDVMIDWTGRNLEELEGIQDVDHRILITQDGWKLNLGEGDQGELYDLNGDPTESVNLFDEPAHRGRVVEMASRIRDWQRATGDAATLPEV